jgi:hypothetical protein
VRPAGRWLLAALSAVLCAAARPPQVEGLGLAQTTGGVLLEAVVLPYGKDQLAGAWFEGGRARLMRCQPHCEVVSSIPLDGRAVLGGASLYRVVLAGKFRSGQRLKVALRFENLQLVTLDLPVGH